ncbi:MAG: NAD(P)-dependent oxidoreductase [Bacillota bacterium]
MTIGIVGFGRMGEPAARRLARKASVLIWDASQEVRRHAASSGFAVAGRCSEIGRNAHIVMLFLPGPLEVEQVVAGEGGLLTAMNPGSVIVDLSTVGPSSSQRNARVAEQHGIGYIDAPVLGRPQACGEWTLPVGGDPDTLERVRPYLEAIARRIVHVGPVGSGDAVKLLNNLIFASINVIAAEVMSICARAGVDPKTFFDVVSTSNAATVSPLFLELGAKILAEDFTPIFTIDLLNKDISLGITMAREHGIFPIASMTNLLVTEMARGIGMGSKDTAALVSLYEHLWGRSASIVSLQG